MRIPFDGARRAQVATDFLASYGIAMIVMVIAVAIAYKISYASRYIFSQQCVPSPGFSCGFYSINESGLLSINMQQSLGVQITVKGVACSTSTNQTSYMPAYGNIYVTNNTSYYPSLGSPGTGVSIASGALNRFRLYCYQSTGRASSSQLGNTFIGYVWLNYTVTGTGIRLTQQIVSVQIKYS